MVKSFEYIPLKAGEIRLLHHSMQDGHVAWTLQPIQLKDRCAESPVEFDALSYTWGDPSHTFPFQCNGSELRIHENLKNALPYLARRRSSLPIWIDAVCINQSDDDEKFVQISMMHSIYRQATQVWVWLGSDPGHEEEAIALLPKIAAVGKEMEDLPWGPALNQPSPVDKGLPAFRSPQWQAVTKISNNKWFLRLWIVQEAALPKKIRVLYGQEEISWDVLGDVVDVAAALRFQLCDADGYKPPKLAQGLPTVFSIRNFTQSMEQEDVPFALMRLIVLTAHNHYCFDPRDRVFGILGFFSERDLQRVGIHGNMKVNELYTKLTRFLFANPENPREISMYGKIFDTVEALFPELLNAHKWQIGFDSYQEAVGMIISQHFWEESLATAVLGNKVEELPDDPTQVVIPGDRCRVQFTLDDYWRSLVGNLTERYDETLEYETYRAFRVGLARYAALLEKLDVDVDNFSLLEECAFGRAEDLETNEYDEETLALVSPGTPCLRFMIDCAHFQAGRKPFITSSGRFGFGPTSLQKGDQVCVFDFAQAPNVLRRDKEDNGMRYQVLGQAYVHGMMYGEVETLGIEEQEIILV
ncbi:hypothetical protein LQW54_013278 [Pestalotiopsis sp. IQ-011]